MIDLVVNASAALAAVDVRLQYGSAAGFNASLGSESAQTFWDQIFLIGSG